MPITRTFSYPDIEAAIEKKIEAKKNAVIKAMIYIGKMCVNEARSLNTYKDQTGNLRSSIGFLVINDGSVVSQSNFPVVKKGAEGKEEGKTFIKTLIAEHSNGTFLIVVAGMQYASYVEAMNLDVLSSAELLAERKVPEMLKQLGFKVR